MINFFDEGSEVTSPTLKPSDFMSKPAPFLLEQPKNSYSNAVAKQFGNMHERMKWLKEKKEALRHYVEKTGDRELWALFQDVGVAVMDLETEVRSAKAVDPPFGQR